MGELDPFHRAFLDQASLGAMEEFRYVAPGKQEMGSRCQLAQLGLAWHGLKKALIVTSSSFTLPGLVKRQIIPHIWEWMNEERVLIGPFNKIHVVIPTN